MLKVTPTAKEKFKGILQKRDTDPGVAIRYIVSPLVPDKFNLILYREKESDQVVKSEDGINILLI